MHPRCVLPTAPQPRFGWRKGYTPPRTITLKIGDVQASREAVVLRTVLGSCVAVCLFDPVRRIGGMNHILLPGRALPGETGEAARYGVHAMELLINAIMRLGGERRELRAKVFGGVSVLDVSVGGESVAERNAEFALRFLENEGIPVLAFRIGGAQPLQVDFYTASAKTVVRTLPLAGSKRLHELIAEERERARKMRESYTGGVEIF